MDRESLQKPDLAHPETADSVSGNPSGNPPTVLPGLRAVAHDSFEGDSTDQDDQEHQVAESDSTSPVGEPPPEKRTP